MDGLFGPESGPIEGDTIWQRLGNMIDRAAPDRVGTTNRDAACGAMKENVVGHILDGKLLAYGFEEPRKVDDHAREIPSEACRYPVDWDYDSDSDGAGTANASAYERTARTVIRNQ